MHDVHTCFSAVLPGRSAEGSSLNREESQREDIPLSSAIVILKPVRNPKMWNALQVGLGLELSVALTSTSQSPRMTFMCHRTIQKQTHWKNWGVSAALLLSNFHRSDWRHVLSTQLSLRELHVCVYIYIWQMTELCVGGAREWASTCVP